MSEPQTALLDPVAFRQVWRRVMPQDRPDCPFTLDEPGPAAPPLVRAAPVSPASAVCLGENSAGELPTLTALLGSCVDGFRLYRLLLQKLGARDLLAPLRDEKRRQAHRLSTAYFLISGQVFDPAPTPAPVIRSLPYALRDRFHAEELLALQFRSAGDLSPDPCLSQLYHELARETQAFGDIIRAYLEKKS